MRRSMPVAMPRSWGALVPGIRSPIGTAYPEGFYLQGLVVRAR